VPLSFLERGLAALEAAGEELAHLDGRFLVPALALQLGGLGLRAVVWRNVLAAAYPDRRVPLVSVAGAYAAGVGLNAFLPARGGEVVKLALIRARLPGSNVSTIAATLSVVVALDLVVGAALLAGLAVAGETAVRMPSAGPLPFVLAAAVVVVGFAAACLRPRRLRTLLAHLAQGAAILRTPGRYLRTVAPFQVGAWACKIGVAFFVLAAFGIKAGLATAALIVVLNGLSTVVPVPGGVGTQQVLAAYALRGVAPLAGAVSFSVGLQVGITTVNTLVGLTALMLMLRTVRPLAAIRSGAGLAGSAYPGAAEGAGR
jgi:uncharacterized membrane protein YbhN (UPF0104 family)